MPIAKGPTTHAHIMNRYTQGFGNSFAFYNMIWEKKQDTEVIQKYLTILHVHAVIVLHVTLL